MTPTWNPFSAARRGKVNNVLPTNYDPDWYRTSFDDDYELIYRHTDDTANREVKSILRYLGLPLKANGHQKHFLDVGCGWGRHGLRLVQRGYNVTGVDLSGVMLKKGARLAGELGVQVTCSVADEIDPSANNGRATKPDGPLLSLVKLDMRKLDWHEEFDFAINVFTSFGYFPDEDDNARVLRGIRDALKPGGRLLIDVDNAPQYVTRRLGTSTVVVTGRDAEGHEVTRVEDFDYDRSRRVVTYRFDDVDREPIYLECALYDRHGLTAVLEEAGFSVDAQAWGDFDQMRYSARSPRLILVAMKTP
jgi:SAM-dependent methyltransferase